MRAAPTRRTAPVPPEHAVLALVNELARAEAKAAKLETQLRCLRAEKRKNDVKDQGNTTRNHARSTRAPRVVDSPKDDPAPPSTGKDLHATLRDALIQLKVYRKHVQLLQSERQQLLAQWPHLAANLPSNAATATRPASPDAGPRSAPPIGAVVGGPILEANPPAVAPPVPAPPPPARSPSPNSDPERLWHHDALALDTSWANREALIPGIGVACAQPDVHTQRESFKPFTNAFAPAMHPPAHLAPPIPAVPAPAPAPAAAADTDRPAHGVSLITVPAGESLLAIDLTLPLAPQASTPAAIGRHRTALDELPACEPTVAVIREFESTRGMTRNVRRLLAHTRGGGRSGTRSTSPHSASPSTSTSVSLIDAGWPILRAENLEMRDDRGRRAPSTRRAPAPRESHGEFPPVSTAPAPSIGLRAAEPALATSLPGDMITSTAHDAVRAPSQPSLVEKSAAIDVRQATRASCPDSERAHRCASRRQPQQNSRDTAHGLAVTDPVPAAASPADPAWDEDLDEITALLNGMPLGGHVHAAGTAPRDPRGQQTARATRTTETRRATSAHRRRRRGLQETRPPLLPGADEESLASLSALIDHLELADSGNVPSRM
ncbi:hypothetical protein GGF31_002923 [Allomyces arbusculus]|nr:hypothetical protein GGF31_002923 [Allomyces arbusculus]